MNNEYKLISKFQSNGINMVIVTIGSAACAMEEVEYNRIIKAVLGQIDRGKLPTRHKRRK